MNKSIWELETIINGRDSLKENIQCDILIVGAGISGIILGYLLSLENKDVVIIEANTIASGTTKNTTAKISAQHSLIYHNLLCKIGKEKAKLFYEGNNLALNTFEEIINKEKIDCDFERRDSFVYSLRNNKKIDKEFKAYKKLNIKGEIVNEVGLPFKVYKALVMPDQACFNPLKFIKSISKNLKIYEHTKMIKIRDKTIITDNNYEIKANKIVIATHFPIIDDYGYYFLKQHQDKSYLLALKNANPVKGMYIDENIKNGFTMRDYKDYLLFGGFSHKTGSKSDEFFFKKLEKEAHKYFKDCEIVCKFSAQDCMSLDHMPYAGIYSKKSTDVFVLTGFNKWGMTGSMLGSLIVKDLIDGKSNKYSKLLSPSRVNLLASTCNFTKNALNSVYGLFVKRIIMKRKDVIELNKNDSLIIKYKKKYIGIYKDENEEVYMVDVRCPHLGCILSFNKEERTYECPCHGSKFDYKGNLISSPSIYNAKKYKL